MFPVSLLVFLFVPRFRGLCVWFFPQADTETGRGFRPPPSSPCGQPPNRIGVTYTGGSEASESESGSQIRTRGTPLLSQGGGEPAFKPIPAESHALTRIRSTRADEAGSSRLGRGTAARFPRLGGARAPGNRMSRGFLRWPGRLAREAAKRVARTSGRISRSPKEVAAYVDFHRFTRTSFQM